MDDLTQLIDDALNLRITSSHKCFLTNIATEKLRQSDERAFSAIKKFIESSDLRPLLDKPGLNGVLGSLFVLGNRYCLDELCGILKTWSPSLIAPLLAQGPLALQGEEVAQPLGELIEKLKRHPDAMVKKWADRFA